MSVFRPGRVTVESIRPQIDLERVHELLREMDEMGDYERRLIEMGLRIRNRNAAKFLPPKAVELLFESDRAGGESSK